MGKVNEKLSALRLRADPKWWILEAVAAELKKLEAGMEETDKEIAGFCKELGIPVPF
jgi:hypothetical protein